jgi:nicotinate-nucleotide pyrophosphorylase (carboxylating)
MIHEWHEAARKITMSAFNPAETAACCRMVELALREDFGDNPPPNFWFQDITTVHYVPPGYTGAAALVARSGGILAGLPAAELVFGALDQQARFEMAFQDGQAVKPGDVLARVRGSVATLLGGERTALNFLQHLSGIASLTNQYVEAVSGLPVKILDTRKTIPGWRLLAKYAVRQGGGHNHRMGLYDGILIKDNHLAFALPKFRCGIVGLIENARKESRVLLEGKFPVEIEVETFEQLGDALAGRPDIILLDNMPLEMMRESVRRRNQTAPGVLLEASGGVTLQTVRAIAETGVDRISVGALTHSAPALDIALDYEA